MSPEMGGPGSPRRRRGGTQGEHPGSDTAREGDGVLLSFHETTFAYGELLAVDGLSLEVRRGEMFGLIGPDGAGKTTTLRIALGLLEPDGGSVTTCGLEPAGDRLALADRVGYLSQRFSLYGDLTVDENVSFFAEIHGVRDWRSRREELLELVRMKPFRERLARHLSGGMKQKLALMCTLVHEPELLVMDEPTTGVDPVSRRDFWKLLSRLQRRGLTLVMSTPYLDEAERCQRVALIDRGRLLALDDPDTLRDGLPGTMVELAAVSHREAVEHLRQLPAVADVETFGERLHVRVLSEGETGTDEDRVVDDLVRELQGAGFEISAARAVGASLEDVFISRIREARDGRREEAA